MGLHVLTCKTLHSAIKKMSKYMVLHVITETVKHLGVIKTHIKMYGFTRIM